MAGGTTRNTSATPPLDRVDELFNQLQLLNQNQNAFAASMAEVNQNQAAFATTMAEVSHRMTTLERRSPERRSPEGSSASQQSLPPPRLKLDVPRFDGTNPHPWIFKISQFFSYHNTPEADRVTIASFYLEGAALSWYQWMYRNGQIHSWMQFLQSLELRFAPTVYDDPKGKLFKLQQTSSVSSYLSDFEALANRIVGLSPLDLLSCFISGLKPEIRREVLAQ